MGDLLGKVSTAPVHVEDVGERDPDAVIEAACRRPMPAGTMFRLRPKPLLAGL